MNENQGEKKIIVDEDWKSQVQAEKERLQQPQSESTAADAPPQAQMPPASFGMLVSTLATEAMVGLGQLPHPATDEPALNLEQAKFFIDTLGVLEEKTQGNLTSEESQSLEALLHQLRLVYVDIRDQQARKS